MRKLIHLFGLFFLLLPSLASIAQNIEIIGGIGKNNFFNWESNEEAHFSSSYNPGITYSFTVAFEGISLDTILDLRLSLSYVHYSGKLNVNNSGLGGNQNTVTEVNKSVISFGIIPLNFKIKKRVDLNIGMEISWLLNENLKGTFNSSYIDQSGHHTDINEKYDRFSKKSYLGVRVRLAYDINLNERIIISPQYTYYHGIEEEFKSPFTKSMRQYFSIGIQKKLSTKK